MNKYIKFFCLWNYISWKKKHLLQEIKTTYRNEKKQNKKQNAPPKFENFLIKCYSFFGQNNIYKIKKNLKGKQ